MSSPAPDARPAGDRRPAARAPAAVPRASALAAAALAWALVAAAPARAAAPHDARLASAAEAFARAWLERRPALAIALGVDRAAPRPEPRTPTAVARDLAVLRAAAARVTAADPELLSPAARIDRALVLGRIEAERLALEVARRDEHDPAAALEPAAASVGGLLAREGLNPCERLVRAARGLRGVPEALRAGRVHARPSRAAAASAAARLEDAVRVWRVALLPRTLQCRDAWQQAAFATADTLAVAAALELREALRLEPRAGAPAVAPLGPAALAAWLAAEAARPVVVDSILSRAARELEAERARMDALAGRLGAGGARAALDALAADTTAPLVAVRTALRLARAAGAAGAFPDVESARLEARLAPSWRVGGGPVVLVAPGAWERRGYDPRLDVDPARAARAGPWACAVEALREGLPGRWLVARAAAGLPSRARQAFASEAAVGAWCDLAARTAIEAAPGAADPRLELAWRARRARVLARALVEVSLHGRGMQPEDAAALLEEWALLAPAEAALEAAHAATWPSTLAPLVLAWDLEDLRAEARARLGPRFDAATFHAALLDQGPVPPALLRDAVLDGAAALTPRMDRR